MSECLTCKRTDVPTVTGGATIACAHVSPKGEPCTDGGPGLGDCCTRWCISRQAMFETRTPNTQAGEMWAVRVWQELNLAELSL